MGDSYVLIAGSQVEPFLQQVWVAGPGNAYPGQVVLTPTTRDRTTAEQLLVDLTAIPTEHGLCTFKPVIGGYDCPFDRQCNSCEHFVLPARTMATGNDRSSGWAALAEGAPGETARDYIYSAFEKSSQALAGLEKALLALGLLDQAKELDLRSPHQDFFDPIWRQGWRARDLVDIGSGQEASGTHEQLTNGPGKYNAGRRVMKQVAGTQNTARSARPERAIDARRRAAVSKVTAVEKAIKALGRTGAPLTRVVVAHLAKYHARSPMRTMRRTG